MNKIGAGDRDRHAQIYTASHPLKASDRIVGDGSGSRALTTTKPVVIGNKV